MALASMPLPGGGVVHFDERSREEVRFLIEEIFGDDGYLQHGVSLGPDAVIFDVGANIGLFSIFASRHAPARVLAFEPIPPIHRALKKNLETNGINGVEPIDCGLTSRSGPREATFTYFAGLPASSTMHREAKLRELDRFRDAHLQRMAKEHPVLSKLWAPTAKRRLEQLAEYEEVTCRLDTVEEVVAAEAIDRIDLLKVDVEGAELEVLDGVGDAWPIVAQVVLETHGDENAAEARTLLESRGFSVVVATPKFAAELGLDNRGLWAVR